MVTDFINSVRECFKIGGVAKRQDEAEQCGIFLVGYEGRLFKVLDDYQIAESVDGFDACGQAIWLHWGASMPPVSLWLKNLKHVFGKHCKLQRNTQPAYAARSESLQWNCRPPRKK